MKKTIFFFFLLLLSLSGTAQSAETEPNNSFATAGNMANYDTLYASVGGADAVDYFKPDINYWTTFGYSTGSIVISVTATNAGPSAARLKMDLFNGLQAAGLVYSDSTASIAPGATQIVTFRYCSQYIDNFYTAFTSDGEINYKVIWYFTDPNPNTEPNNTRPTAAAYTFDTLNLKREAIGYQFRQNANTDTDDWFKTVVPGAGAGNVSLRIQAKNNSCQNSRWIQYAVYKNNDAAPLATGYVGNNQFVAAYTETVSDVDLGSLQVSDSIFIRIWSNAAFGYNLKYKTTLSTLAYEPNDVVSQATPLSHNQTLATTLGTIINGTYDEYDYFRVILPRAGSVRFYITGSNSQCPNDGNFVDMELYDKNLLAGTNIRSTYVGGLFWDDTECSISKTDSFTVNTLAADTFYLQLIGYDPLNYTVRYQMIGAEPLADVEPNNSEAAAGNILQGETKAGNLGYWKAFPFDTDDYYKASLAAKGNMRVYVKATYRGATVTNNSNNVRLRLLVTGSATTYALPENPPTQVVQNATYLDTFRICNVPAGNVFLRVQSSSGTGLSTTLRPFEYEIRYEMEPALDTTADIEPDNSFAEARVIGSGQIRRAFLGLMYNGQSDVNDYFKMVVPPSEIFKLYWRATNISCTDDRLLRIWGYNKSKQQIFFKGYVLNAVGTVDAGQTVTDSLTEVLTATNDTVFIRFEGNGLFDYDFHTNLLLPSTAFKIVGDTTACEGPQYIYKAANIVDSNITYQWSLPLGGGTISAVDSIARVTWNASGNRKVQLSLSNARGSTAAKQLNVVVNGVAPTQIPVAYNFARTLSTNSLPPGGGTQWFKDGVAISGATDSTYYAADAGSYTVKFTNDCGPGPSSNAIVFNAAALPQTINFPHTANLPMSPTAKIILGATASSGLPVFYQKISGPATLLNDTLFITGVGTVIVKSLQPGDDVYSPATPVFDTITIVKGSQFIIFDSIPPQVLNSTDILLDKVSSAGLTITYTVVAGTGLASVNNLSGSASSINKLGAGLVTLRATQAGNANYNAATPVERTFCIGIRTLTPITGDANPCLATYRYHTQKIPGAVYEWSLSGGGILTTHNDTAWVQWQTAGSYTLKVKANSPCDSVYTNEQVLNLTTSGNPPSAAGGMQPANGAIDQKLPLTLSWIPGSNTVSYDLYVWDSTAVEPSTPYAANLTTVSYTLAKNSLAYNKAYKWKVVAKNPCSQTPGPIQSFRIIPLPDLIVSDVQAPLTAVSGETITVSWKVTNIGPGKTFTDDSWQEGVYFSLDSVNSWTSVGTSWNSLLSTRRPLLLGKKTRPVALDSGQSYINSFQYTLPKEYSAPVYVFVITNDQNHNYPILQASVANDTARTGQQLVISLAPAPDLRVDSVFAPLSAFSGSTINVSYKVKNYGVVTPAGQAWSDSVFISQNPLFDRNACIPLAFPKSNGSYYPNTVKGGTAINTQLNSGSTYTKSLSVVIPNFIFGTWFIYVKTNAATKSGGFVYEGSLDGNNVNQAQMQIFLTPTPKLTVNSLTLPQTTASTTQTVGLNYVLKNEGFTDNFEKSKGHYLLRMTGRCPCNAPPGCNCVCVGAPYFYDSLAQGSSYWIDRVYISTEASLNTATARLIGEKTYGKQFSGSDYFDDYTPAIQCSAGAGQGAHNVAYALYPGSEFPTDMNFKIPSDLAPGNYYVYVYTNPTKTVFEYPGTPQIKRSSLPIAVSRPDAVVSSISVPGNSVGGQQLSISYSITNNGPGAVFNHVRKDQLYSSNFPNFDASATLLATQTFTEDLPVATAVPHTFTYQLPAATSGTKYFYVVTNFDSSFRETISTNNLSTAALTNVSAAIPNDLIVASIQSPDTVFTIFNSNIGYTVSNSGSGTTAGTWTDSLFASCSPTFNRATSFFVARKTQTRATGPGESYTDTISFTIPKMSYELNSCFPQAATAPAYFFIKTNADSVVYEAANTNNNITGSGSRIIANPLVDHIVSSITLNTDTITVGKTFTANWKVRNIGYKPPYQYYNGYTEGIFVSADSVYNSVDELAGRYIKYVYLERNDSVSFNASVITPNLPTGDYYVFAVTNYSNGIPGEKVLTNNANLVRSADGKAKKIHLIRPLLPDLTDSILVAPESVVAGQPITIIHRITNNGVGVTYPASWKNSLWLSADFSTAANMGDRLLSEKPMSTTLLPGQAKDDTVTVTVPITTVPGNYVLIGEADARENMAEGNESNNLGFKLITVFAPPVTDLLVENITKPDTVYLGYTIDTVRWVVKNVSANEAKGKSTDGVYLSQGNIFDSTATLLGIKDKTVNLDPLKADTVKLAPLVTGVTEGAYNVIVRTDVLNNFLEENKENNTAISTTPIYVKVKELQMNVAENNTLQKVRRFYKLRIPDSLIGSTILVTLKTPDSLLVRNEIYMGGGYVPTAAKHDYKFEIPNYGNQQIVMTSVTDSVYYIEVKCVSTNPPAQIITLKAVKLPFAVLNVHTNSGGNIGNVTVKISGSLFVDGMTATLGKAGTTINASAVYFTNSTTVYATFSLQGQPLGVYDVILTKADASTAVLPNGFSVVTANNGGLITGGGVNTGPGNGNAPGCDPGAPSGLNSQLVVDLIAPSLIYTNTMVAIVVNYSNPTNFDIPAQSRILYSEAGMKLSFTREGVPGGATSIYLELTEPGGPPGIIRAGGSGSIIVYSRTPAGVPPNKTVLLKLK